MLAGRMKRGIIEDRAGGLAIGREIAQHIADPPRRADLHHAVPLTREQARHFLHPDPGQGRIILLRRAQGIGQQGAAAPPLLILAHIGRNPACRTDHHAWPLIHRAQHYRKSAIYSGMALPSTRRSRPARCAQGDMPKHPARNPSGRATMSLSRKTPSAPHTLSERKTTASGRSPGSRVHAGSAAFSKGSPLNGIGPMAIRSQLQGQPGS